MKLTQPPQGSKGAGAATDSPIYDKDGKNSLLKAFELRKNHDQNVEDFNFFENQRMKKIQSASANLGLNRFTSTPGNEQRRSISPTTDIQPIPLEFTSKPRGIVVGDTNESISERRSALKAFAVRPSTGSAPLIVDPSPVLQTVDPNLMRQQLYDRPATGIHALKDFMVA